MPHQLTDTFTRLPFAIFDASRALDIDANNTKALLRRGLGLARVQKWDEAIVGE